MIIEQFDGFISQLIVGTWVTLKLAVCALLLGLVSGLVGMLGETCKITWLRYLSTTIIGLLRGLPEVLILFFIYFGSGILLSKLWGQYVEVTSFTAGMIALGLIFGAYASQTFRGAFQAIPNGQREAAQALGLTRWYIFRKILLPQAWRYALPGLSNLWFVLLKDTALVSLIGLADLMNNAQIAASSTQKPFTFFVATAIIYLLLTTASQTILNYFIHRSNRHLTRA